MKKNDYYKTEVIRILLFPILLWLVASLLIDQGHVKTEDAPILWIIIAIETVANFTAVVLVYVFDRNK